MGITPSYYSTAGTALRGLAYLALSDTGYILRGSVTDNLGGGGTLTWGTAGTVWCRVAPAGGAETEMAEGIFGRDAYTITVPALTNVTTADRFKADGIEFEIAAVNTRTDEQLRTLDATRAADPKT